RARADVDLRHALEPPTMQRGARAAQETCAFALTDLGPLPKPLERERRRPQESCISRRKAACWLALCRARPPTWYGDADEDAGSSSFCLPSRASPDPRRGTHRLPPRASPDRRAGTRGDPLRAESHARARSPARVLPATHRLIAKMLEGRIHISIEISKNAAIY